MKIPDSVRIGGIDYAVVQEPDINYDGKILYGRVSFEASTIALNTVNQEHQFKCVTLLHEILHAIAEHTNLSLGKDEEKIIDTFAFGIYQVLQDNGRRLFDIKEAEE